MALAYYNEIDPHAAQWLRNLIEAGEIAPGYVDTRSIRDVRAVDLDGFMQWHFFAGLGGWPLALRRAGWADDRSACTGSCPCQPFSIVGQGLGFADDRHLWPDWYRLIRELRPPAVLGEQVARGGGQRWLDLVFSDLEAIGYACGAANLSAGAFGAWHLRPRLWFFADADEARWAHSARMPAAEAEGDLGRSSRVAYRQGDGAVRRPPQPDAGWVVDGLSGVGPTVGALGNAIDQRPATAFVRAVMAALPSPPSAAETGGAT